MLLKLCYSGAIWAGERVDRECHLNFISERDLLESGIQWRGTLTGDNMVEYLQTLRGHLHKKILQKVSSEQFLVKQLLTNFVSIRFSRSIRFFSCRIQQFSLWSQNYFCSLPGITSYLSAGYSVFVTFMDEFIVQGLFSKGIKFHIVRRFSSKIIKVIC